MLDWDDLRYFLAIHRAGTLARDLESFEVAGYSLDRILPYDFFPLTHHVEALALLDRRR